MVVARGSWHHAGSMRLLEPTARLLPLLAALALMACPRPPQAPPPEAPPPEEQPAVEPPQKEVACTPDVPPERLTRLSPVQYTRVIEALLGEGEVPRLPEPTGEVPSLLEVEALSTAASALVSGLGEHAAHRQYAPCDVEGSAFDDACAESFIHAFGQRAFRRPLHPDETSALLKLYAQVRDADVLPEPRFAEALDRVAEAILQAPQLWYRTADAQLPAGPDGTRPTTAHERAERLAFLLTDAPPDEALSAAADTGALLDDAVLRAHAERLLDSPLGQARLGRFASAWLGLDKTHKQVALEDLHKVEALAPPDSPTLRGAMRREVERGYAAFVAEGEDFEALLTDTRAWVNGELAAHYGVSPPAFLEEGWVYLPAHERAGLITRAAFLTAHAGPERSSPIRRGVHLYRHLMCQPLGDPPPEASEEQPNPDEGLPLTTRRIAEGKTRAPSCQACHRLVNPPGFTLERYDALGRYRTVEWAEAPGGPVQAPIDAAAVLTFADVRGEANGPITLSQMLSKSPTAKDCHVQTVMEHALGRRLTAADACELQTLQARFREGGSLRELWLSVATGETVRRVRP